MEASSKRYEGFQESEEKCANPRGTGMLSLPLSSVDQGNNNTSSYSRWRRGRHRFPRASGRQSHIAKGMHIGHCGHFCKLLQQGSEC